MKELNLKQKGSQVGWGGGRRGSGRCACVCVCVCVCVLCIDVGRSLNFEYSPREKNQLAGYGGGQENWLQAIQSSCNKFRAETIRR